MSYAESEARELHSSGRFRCFVCGGAIQPGQHLGLYQPPGSHEIVGVHPHCFSSLQALSSGDDRVTLADELHRHYGQTGRVIEETYSALRSGVPTKCPTCGNAIVRASDAVAWAVARALGTSPENPHWNVDVSLAFIDSDVVRRDSLAALAAFEKMVRQRVTARNAIYCHACMEPVVGEFRIGVRVFVDMPSTFGLAAFHPDCLPQNVPLDSISKQVNLTESSYLSSSDLLLSEKIHASLQRNAKNQN